MFISDEYGPNIYRFSADAILMSATQPPAALVANAPWRAELRLGQIQPGRCRTRSEGSDTGRQKTTRASKAWR